MRLFDEFDQLLLNLGKTTFPFLQFLALLLSLSLPAGLFQYQHRVIGKTDQGDRPPAPQLIQQFFVVGGHNVDGRWRCAPPRRRCRLLR